MPGRPHFNAWNGDRLEHNNTERMQLHLSDDLGCQNKFVLFIENHNEPHREWLNCYRYKVSELD